MWSRDGRELYYQNSTRLIAVRVLDAVSGFRFEAPRTLLDGGFVPSSISTPGTYDAAPDGRLLMIQPIAGETPRPQFVLVQNWFEELRRRASAP